MEAIGPLLIVLSIPLVFRWVPQNRLYGFRIPATRRNKSVWYDANALCARHMIRLGLLMVALEFVLPLSVRNQTLQAIAVVGMASITIVDWRTANRWERERTVVG
jgi:hypothetical protein